MSDKLLMCKNTPVYNITTEQVLNEKLIPGIMKKCACNEVYKKWLEYRYSALSNSIARMLRGKTFGQGNRQKINDVTRILSLSDCYWTKNEDEDVSFEDISPYYNKFFNGKADYENESIPTLYVPGALPKEWLENKNLFKQGDLSKEIDAISLCKMCKVSVEEAVQHDLGVEFINFTTPDLMLEHANASGLIHSEDFTNEDIIEVFKADGVRMLVIDAIIGNGDRHAGNFGFLRDANTGEYLGMAPLYDFDHALDSTLTDKADILIKELKVIPKEYAGIIKEICTAAKGHTNEVFSKRAEFIEAYLIEY